MKMISRLLLLASIAILLPTTGYSEPKLRKDYTDIELIRILKSEGYRAVELIEARAIEIKVDGLSRYLTVYDDGDLQFYFGSTGYELDAADINKWNRSKRLSRAYLDEENDPILEADLLANAGFTPEQLIETFKVFGESINAFRLFLLEHDKSEQSE